MLDLPVVFLPGLLCDGAVWQYQLDEFSQEHCLVADYGSLDSLTAMAQKVLDEVLNPKIRIVGHSMGGRVALEMARLAPERIERLALLDTGIHARTSDAAGQAEQSQRAELLQIAKDQGMRAMGCQWAKGMVHPSKLETQVFENILSMIGRKTPAIFEAQIKALLARPDAVAVLGALRCPTWIVCGRQDAWSPLARHEQMHVLLTGSQLAVIEDSGHMVTMEQPAAVNKVLRHWIEA